MNRAAPPSGTDSGILLVSQELVQHHLPNPVGPTLRGRSAQVYLGRTGRRGESRSARGGAQPAVRMSVRRSDGQCSCGRKQRHTC